MGFSFGYNKLEDIEDYAVPQALIHTLIKIVSQGGNLLLNIGPTAEGKIPPIMQERLLQIGEWLKVNGEGIYNTRPWKRIANGQKENVTGSLEKNIMSAGMLF